MKTNKNMKHEDIKIGKIYIFNCLPTLKSKWLTKDGMKCKVIDIDTEGDTTYNIMVEFLESHETFPVSAEELIPTLQTPLTRASTLTRPEILEQLKEVFKTQADALMDKIWNDNNALMILESLKNYIKIEKCSSDELANYWCEYCSDNFFNKHPEIEDVLFMTETLNDGTVMKKWLASNTMMAI